MNKVSVNLHYKFEHLFEEKWRNIVYYGGRGGGKSFAVGWALLNRARSKRLRILCTREIQGSIKDSVHKLLSDIIRNFDFTEYEITRDAIRNKLTGSEFLFVGLRDNVSKIKSFEGVDICWVEEAHSVSLESVQILVPTIRKEGSQLIWTFNPETPKDAVWTEIVEQKTERDVIVKIGSEDLERIGQLPQPLKDEREKMKKADYEAYRHIWLGEFKTSKDGAIYAKKLSEIEKGDQVAIIPHDEGKKVYTAWDLGRQDTTAIWFYQIKNGQIYFIDYYEMSQETPAHYAKIIKEKPYNYGAHFLPHDGGTQTWGEEATRADLLRRLGLNNIIILKRNRVADGIAEARMKLSSCFFDKDKCERGLKCLWAYRYKYDEKNQIFSLKPLHDWASNGADAFRYAIQSLALASGYEGYGVGDEDYDYTDELFDNGYY